MSRSGRPGARTAWPVELHDRVNLERRLAETSGGQVKHQQPQRRMWTALLGWGFYPTVNDLGGVEKPCYPEVLRILEKDWRASGQDMRWLFETIALTRAYQGCLQEPDGSVRAPAGRNTWLVPFRYPIVSLYPRVESYA